MIFKRLLRNIKKNTNILTNIDIINKRTILNGKINAVLVNNAHKLFSKSHQTFSRIITPKERWSYAIELSFKDVPKEERALQLTFKVNQGEVGLLCVDLEGKSMDERIIAENAIPTPYLIDCTQENFDRLFIRNTSPYGHSEIDFISAELSTVKLSNQPNTFPGFNEFEISKEDLIFWSDFYGTRASTEAQYIRSKWLERQISQMIIPWQNGIQLCLDPKCNTAKALVVSGYYEPFELSTFQFLASTADTTIDIGANIGIYALTAAIANPSSRVFAAEPSKRELTILKTNADLNTVSNLEILQTAIGEMDGSTILESAPREIAGHNQIADPNQNIKNGWDSYQVNCCRLDSIRLKKNLRIDLIKIDVEGHELAVLKGSISTLNQDKPHILLELSGGLWTNNCHAIQVIALLQNQGYKIFDLDRKLGIWRKFSGWRSEQNGNILCIHSRNIELIFDINTHLIKTFNKEPNPKHYLQSTNLKILDPIHVFCHPSALAINEARMAHLDSLNLNLEGKKVLEVGGGIGLHTPYFLSLGCSVTFTDSRIDNLTVAEQRLENLVKTAQLNLDEPADMHRFDQTEVVYCYGTLYHLAKPAQAILALASTKANMILIETCVNRTKNAIEVIFEKEDINNPNQASSGMGARPTRNWLANELKKYWKYVYFTTTQPAYPDFPENWNVLTTGNTRTIFIGSNAKCFDKSLTPIFPDKQNELEIEYHMAAFDRIDDLFPWLKSLQANSRFMVTIHHKISTIHPTFMVLSKIAVITTISPCLDATTLICGRIKA